MAVLASDPLPRRRAWLAELAAGAAALAWQPRLARAAEPLRLGVSLPLTGEAGREGLALLAGSQAALAGANLRGRALELLALDDAGQPATALKNVQSLAADATLIGLLGTWGAAATLAVLPALEAARLPMLGPVSGAETVRASASRQLFPMRAGWADEAARMVNQLDHQGLNDMAVVHSDDSFGRDSQAAVLLEMNRAIMRPVSLQTLAADARNLEDVATKVAQSQPHAVIVLAPARLAAQFIRRWAGGGFRSSVAVLSETGAGLPGLLGDAGRGVLVSQVWPSPWRANRPLIQAYQAAMRAAHPSTEASKLYSYSSLEGYLSASLMLKALQRLGQSAQPLGREALQAALEGPAFELDGLSFKYGPPPRRGSRFCEMTVLGADGGFKS